MATTSREATVVEASNARETATGAESRRGRGVDVDVAVTLPSGREVDGEVTLLPAEDGRPVYESWGSADHWVSPDLLAEVYAECEGPEGVDRDAVRGVLRSIESAASETASRLAIR